MTTFINVRINYDVTNIHCTFDSNSTFEYCSGRLL